MSDTARLLGLAESWAATAGSTLAFHTGCAFAAGVATWPDAGQRALMRCAIQLYEGLRSAPDFAQALGDLGLEPVGEDGEAP